MWDLSSYGCLIPLYITFLGLIHIVVCVRFSLLFEDEWYLAVPSPSPLTRVPFSPSTSLSWLVIFWLGTLILVVAILTGGRHQPSDWCLHFLMIGGVQFFFMLILRVWPELHFWCRQFQLAVSKHSMTINFAVSMYVEEHCRPPSTDRERTAFSPSKKCVLLTFALSNWVAVFHTHNLRVFRHCLLRNYMIWKSFLSSCGWPFNFVNIDV